MASNDATGSVGLNDLYPFLLAVLGGVILVAVLSTLRELFGLFAGVSELALAAATLLSTALAGLAIVMGSTRGQVTQLADTVERGFDRMGSKLDRMDSKLNKLDKLDTMDQKLDTMNHKLDKLDTMDEKLDEQTGILKDILTVLRERL